MQKLSNFRKILTFKFLIINKYFSLCTVSLKMDLNYLAINNSGTAPNVTTDICDFSLFTIGSIGLYQESTHFHTNKAIVGLSLIMILTGVIMNLISIKILLHPMLRISTNIYLGGLCVNSIFSLIDRLFIMFHGSLIMKIYPFIYPIKMSNQMIANFLLVAVNLNRFIGVWYGTGVTMSQAAKKKKITKENRIAVLIVSCIYVFSILYCIPFWLVYEYNEVKKRLIVTELTTNLKSNWIIQFYMYIPVVYLIPCVILIGTNVYLVKSN